MYRIPIPPRWPTWLLFLTKDHRRIGCLPAFTTEDHERPAQSPKESPTRYSRSPFPATSLPVLRRAYGPPRTKQDSRPGRQWVTSNAGRAVADSPTHPGGLDAAFSKKDGRQVQAREETQGSAPPAPAPSDHAATPGRAWGARRVRKQYRSRTSPAGSAGSHAPSWSPIYDESRWPGVCFEAGPGMRDGAVVAGDRLLRVRGRGCRLSEPGA